MNLQQLCVKFILNSKCAMYSKPIENLNILKNLFLNLDDIDYYRILEILKSNYIYNINVFSIELFLAMRESRRLDYLNIISGQEIGFHESLFQASYCRFLMNNGMPLVDNKETFYNDICLTRYGDFNDIIECIDRCLEYYNYKLRMTLIKNICLNSILNNHEKQCLISRFNEVDVEIGREDDNESDN